ncbi:hypothetical protein FXO38_20822 [Capsicum annuum]|nr:hypothetical protein FXO37_33771 [Capsicum annuum]KAF3643006.1 hypothetical protein FXO38_20822 [Capsicum annuum]
MMEVIRDRRHRVDEEELDYNPEVITHPVDITTARSTSGANSPIFTMAENQTRADDISARMYGLLILRLNIRGRPATLEELHDVELDYPLGHHARTLLWIGPDFLILFMKIYRLMKSGGTRTQIWSRMSRTSLMIELMMMVMKWLGPLIHECHSAI